MQFALIGDHPDGRALASALSATGRHRLLYHISSTPLPDTRVVADPEEVFADPAVTLVILAGKQGERPAQLRRALQSERHVVCVHPVEDRPDTAYEATLIAADTHCVALPLLTEAFHPGVARLRELMLPDSPLGGWQLLHLERAWSDAEALTATERIDRPSFPGWHLLRTLGGEIVEVSALARAEEMLPDEPLLVSGRFEARGLFQIVYLPGQSKEHFRLRLVGRNGDATLWCPQGLDGAAFVSWYDADGALHEEAWTQFDPWSQWVTRVEAALARTESAFPAVQWQDEIRSLELDDAVRRSLERRRTSLLDFQEATEEVGFKGTMTLVGCGMMFLLILVVILLRWLPWLGWVIVPVLVLFLGFQAFGLLTRKPPTPKDQRPAE